MHRNRKAEQYVFSFYESLPKGIRQFPLNIRKAILTLGNCTVYSYQEVVEQNNISIDEVIIFCGSDTGCTVKQDDNYIIMFNDTPDIFEERKAFTLAHELAHILLGHLNGVRDDFNEQFEREANYFAACLLCPMPVLSRLEPMSPVSVRRVFGLSNEATEIALKNHETYDRTDNIQWHNDMLHLFDLQNKKLNFFTYIHNIHRRYEHTNRKAADTLSDEECAYLRCILQIIHPVLEADAAVLPERKTEITISPNLYERVALDWI